MGIHTPTRKPQFRSRGSSDNNYADSDAARTAPHRATTVELRKGLPPSGIRTVTAAVVAVAPPVTRAFPARATAAAAAFSMPGTSARLTSLGTVDVAAIGAAPNCSITQAQQVRYPASAATTRATEPAPSSAGRHSTKPCGDAAVPPNATHRASRMPAPNGGGH